MNRLGLNRLSGPAVESGNRLPNQACWPDQSRTHASHFPKIPACASPMPLETPVMRAVLVMNFYPVGGKDVAGVGLHMEKPSPSPVTLMRK